MKFLPTSLVSRLGPRLAIYAAVVALLLAAGVVALLRQPGGHATHRVPVPSRQASSAASSTVSSSSPAETRTTPSAGGVEAPRRGGGSKVVAWLKEMAPMGGQGDGPEARVLAYRSVTRAECADILKRANGLDAAVRPLFISAGLACRAAFGGSPQSWPAAESSFAEAERSGAAYKCFERDLHEMLRTLFDMRRQYPEAQLVRQPDGDWSRSTCPRIDGIAPNRGRAEGGDLVHLTGAYLPQETVVIFNDNTDFTVRVSAMTHGGRDIYLTTPPRATTRDGDPVESVAVTVEDWPFPEALVTFQYDPPTGSLSASPVTSQPGT